jgi:hypothetical protein
VIELFSITLRQMTDVQFMDFLDRVQGDLRLLPVQDRASRADDQQAALEKPQATAALPGSCL